MAADVAFFEGLATALNMRFSERGFEYANALSVLKLESEV